MASSINLKSGLLSVGALRPQEGNSQEPVALETTVVATGARPGDSTSKRELFTEETQTVLVFEKGAVIRLSAAVADGQLLFLTNKSTGKEVVTQVVRKRAFRPTNCYVDLEFTEPCPGFWGIEFPKAAPTPTAAGASVAKKLAADEDSEHQPAKSTPPPNAHEVERLKQEVSTLQTQLKSLMTSKPNATPGVSEVAGLETGVLPQPELKAVTEISAEVAKKEEERRLEELFAMEDKQEDASNPKILLPHPIIAAEERAEKKGSKTLLNVAAALLVLGAGTFTAYRFGALDDVLKMAGIVKPAPSRPAPAVAKAPPPKPASPVTTTPVATPAISAASSADANAAENPPAVSAPLLEEKNPVTVVDAANETEWKDNTGSSGKSAAASASRLNPADSAARIRSRAVPTAGSGKRNDLQPAAKSGTEPRTVAGNAAAPASLPSGSDASAAVAVDAEGVVAPKLIQGHKSMAPPDMIRKYITGSVNVDAVVDSTGHVRSVTVVSGPEKLRSTAIEEMKQYLYQPAKKNGKPVPAHVQVSLQFWYEP